MPSEESLDILRKWQEGEKGITDYDCLLIGQALRRAVGCRNEPGYMGEIPFYVEYIDNKSSIEVMDWRGRVMFTIRGMRHDDASGLSVEFGGDDGGS